MSKAHDQQRIAIDESEKMRSQLEEVLKENANLMGKIEKLEDDVVTTQRDKEEALQLKDEEAVHVTDQLGEKDNEIHLLTNAIQVLERKDEDHRMNANSLTGKLLELASKTERGDSDWRQLLAEKRELEDEHEHVR